MLLRNRLATTRLARSGPIAVAAAAAAAAADLLTAVWDALEGDASLAAAIGRTGWLWRPGSGGIPGGVVNPVAALAWVAGTTRLESIGPDGLRPFSGDGEIQITLWTDTIAQTSQGARDQALSLGYQVAAVLEAAELAWTRGRVIGLWWTNPDDGPELEDDPGPRGQDVWRLLLRFRVLTAGSLP